MFLKVVNFRGSPSVSPWNGDQCYVYDHLDPRVMIFEYPVVSQKNLSRTHPKKTRILVEY